MDRRAFIRTLTGGLLAAPVAAGCQPAGMRAPLSPPPTDPRARVLTYLQSLKAKPSQHFVMGQITGWPGQGRPDREIPPLLAVNGNVAPGLIGTIWGEVGVPEDDAHWRNGWDATVMQNEISGLIAFWNAGCLVTVSYMPALPAGTDFTAAPYWGRFDTITNSGPTHPIPIPSLLKGSLSCSQWRNSVLHTGQTYTQLLDYHAAYLQRLKDAGVVVIYRPFAEMDSNLKRPFSGDLALWDRSLSPSDFVALWRFVHDYFTNTKGLRNLIWHWCLLDGDSVGAGRNGMSYYPGDAYVDIVGFDDYCDGNNLRARPTYTALGQQLPTKPMILGEFGINTPGTPRDLATWVAQVKTTMPNLVGGLAWPAPWSLSVQSNLVVGMADAWLQNSPVPLEGGGAWGLAARTFD